ncbi:hypothetical protein KSP40_PGU013394 [Platanthera guangdongensis]|uniref:Uncharacterized protein n=1 Tax=Platanthera guangdongensis TaxID=2320717 RepID=A0ABR2MP14_9ASPA
MRLDHPTSTSFPSLVRLQSTQEHCNPLASLPLAQLKFGIAADKPTSPCEAVPSTRIAFTSSVDQTSTISLVRYFLFVLLLTLITIFSRNQSVNPSDISGADDSGGLGAVAPGGGPADRTAGRGPGDSVPDMKKTKSGFDVTIQARSSVELARKFRQVKQEKADILHRKLRERKAKDPHPKKLQAEEPASIIQHSNQHQAQQVTRNRKRPSMLIDDSVGVYEISPKGRNQHDQIQPPIKVNQNQPSLKVNKKLPPSRKLDFEHSETNDLLRVDGALNQEDVEVVEPNKEITKDPHPKKLQPEEHASIIQHFNQHQAQQVERNKKCPSMLIDDFVGVYDISPKGTNQHDQIQPLIKVNQNLSPSKEIREELSGRNESLLQADGFLNQENVEVVERNKEIDENLERVWNYTKRSKMKRDPTQAEVFIETRSSISGKELDLETNNAISQLQDTMNNEKSNVEAFKIMFGKEHPGSMRCFGKGSEVILKKQIYKFCRERKLVEENSTAYLLSSTSKAWTDICSVQEEEDIEILLCNMPSKKVFQCRPTTRSSKQLLVEEIPKNNEVAELSPILNTPSPNRQQSQSRFGASDDDTTINEGNDESPIHGSTNTVGSPSIRRGRGVTTGRSIEKAILENDKKLLDIEFPEGFKKPRRYAKHLANGVGVIVRQNAGLDFFDPMEGSGARAETYFICCITYKSVQEFMEEMFQRSYTHWRGRLSATYKGYIVAGKNPRASSPFEWISIENLCQLCDLFENENFKKRSKTNAVNRSHMSFTHTSGSKSYHSRLPEMVNQSPVENFVNTHRKNGVFVISAWRAFDQAILKTQWPNYLTRAAVEILAVSLVSTPLI